jgi:hypothetical protein
MYGGMSLSAFTIENCLPSQATEQPQAGNENSENFCLF